MLILDDFRFAQSKEEYIKELNAAWSKFVTSDMFHKSLECSNSSNNDNFVVATEPPGTTTTTTTTITTDSQGRKEMEG